MFGNYMLNTQSMGGKRRGLIYVSDDATGNIPFAKNFQFMQANGMVIETRVTYKGKVTLALRFSNAITNRQYPVNVNGIQYNADYYPLCIAPKSYIFLKNKDISLTSHIQQLNAVLPSCLYLAEENLTFTSHTDQSQITVPYIVLYLKTSEADVITVSGNQYYDLTAYQGMQYEVSLPKIALKTTEASTIMLEGRYWYNPYFNNGNLEFKDLNTYKQCMVSVNIEFTPSAYSSGTFGTMNTKSVFYASNDLLTLDNNAYNGTPFLFGCCNFGYYEDYQSITGYGVYETPTITDVTSYTDTDGNMQFMDFDSISSQHFTINTQVAVATQLFNTFISTFIQRVKPVTPLAVSPTIINPFNMIYNSP